MKMTSPPVRAGSLKVRLLWSLGAVAAFVVAVSLFTKPQPTTPTPPGATPVGVQNSPATSAQARAEQELTNLVERMRPNRLGISTDPDSLVDELNRWFAKNADQAELNKLTSDEDLRKRFLSEEQYAETVSDRYTLADIIQVRQAFLGREIIDWLTQGKRNDAERLNAIFDYVVTTLLPLPDDAKEGLPLTPYEAILFGVGTPADRAWAFTSLVNQPPLSMDCVIITPSAEEKKDHWILGAIDSAKNVWLFDPHEGVPLPSPTDGGSANATSLPGTLKEVLADSELLKELDVPDSPYPLKADDLKDASVELIAVVNQFAPRMASLRYLLPSDMTIDFYRGLGSNEIRQQGVLEHMREVGNDYGWSEDSMTIWDYPTSQREKVLALTGLNDEDNSSSLAQMFVIFKAPYVFQEGDGRVSLVPSNTTLRYVRGLLLTGEHGEALKEFLPIRTAPKASAGEPIPPNIIAAQYATLWSAICQFETGRTSSARKSLERYLSSNPSTSVQTAIEWLAKCHLKEGHPQKSIEVLQSSPTAANSRRTLLRIKRWQSLTDQDSESDSE